MKFLWEVGVCESKKWSSESNCFLWTVLPESRNYFSITPSDTTMANLYFKAKVELPEKKKILAFLGGSKEAISTMWAALNIVHDLINLLYYEHWAH